MAGLIVSAVAKWNGAALKKGQKDLTSFQKSTLSLAKAFAATFAAQKIYAFGKASVKAFAADEKAAKSLEIALKNTGNGFAAIATEGFISRMQQTYKVLDDELRPAFQTLLTATGSLTESQKGLELALNVSAGTTKSVQEVSMALAKAYGGQTTALSRLGAGLDKATLASGDMNLIMSELTSRFQGQALAATKTYAGQMAALGVASANVKEIIGKGILDSLAALGSSDGISKATAEMEKFAQSSADALLGVSTLLAKFKGTSVGGGLSSAFSSFMNSGYLASIGKNERLKNAPFSPTSMYMTTETAERAKLIATIKKGNAIETAKQKLTAAELAAKNKALADQKNLDELKKKFDVDRINLQTALANSTDESEKARIRSLLTIMDEDAASAGKRLAELDKANADRLKTEAAATKSINDLGLAASLAALRLTTGGAIPGSSQVFPGDFGNGGVAGTGITPDLSNYPSDGRPIPGSDQVYAGDFGNGGVAGGTTNITFNNAVGTDQFFTDAVLKAVQQANRFGNSQYYAGALVP
jgi:hypothetical protein